MRIRRPLHRRTHPWMGLRRWVLMKARPLLLMVFFWLTRLDAGPWASLIKHSSITTISWRQILVWVTTFIPHYLAIQLPTVCFYTAPRHKALLISRHVFSHPKRFGGNLMTRASPG